MRVDHARVKRTILWVLESHARMFAVATGTRGLNYAGFSLYLPYISTLESILPFDKDLAFCAIAKIYSWTLFNRGFAFLNQGTW